jgi:hypothetical protein
MFGRNASFSQLLHENEHGKEYEQTQIVTNNIQKNESLLGCYTVDYDYQSIWRSILQDLNLHQHRYENLKSRIAGSYTLENEDRLSMLPAIKLLHLTFSS